MIDKIVKKMVEEYQCPGCVCGNDTSCYEKSDNLACSKHVVGTVASGHVGKFFLGLPTGFCRLGFFEDMKIDIFKNISDGWGFDFLNVPVWKHLDKNGNTLVRGICPRINMPFIHIFIGNVLDEIDCFEITKTHLDGMD